MALMGPSIIGIAVYQVTVLNNSDLLNWIIENYAVFTLVLVRVAAMLFLMPVFSSSTVPMRVKAAAAFVLALMLTPWSRGHRICFPHRPFFSCCLR